MRANGSDRRGTRRAGAPATRVAAFVLALALGGCSSLPLQFNPFNPFDTNGRDGSNGPPPSYEALMRIGVAALQGGDYSNAVGIFRRAAELAPREAPPFSAAGDALLQMGAVDEAIVSYNSALGRDPHYAAALHGVAKAYLETGRPELALHPLSLALTDDPKDVRALLLIGVADDLTGNHGAAQDSYHHGLDLAPGDPGLSVDLAMSLTLTGDYPAAVQVLLPVVAAPTASPQDRQTLALIYGLAGNKKEASRLGRMDLDEAAVENNLAYYDSLRDLTPTARERAIELLNGVAPVAENIPPM